MAVASRKDRSSAGLPDARALPADRTSVYRRTMLPDIKISLPIIFLLWCAAAVLLVGPVMLAYPAMWLVVGIAFWAFDRVVRASRPESPAPAPANESIG